MKPPCPGGSPLLTHELITWTAHESICALTRVTHTMYMGVQQACHGCAMWHWQLARLYTDLG